MYIAKLQTFNVPVWVKKEANKKDTKFEYHKKYKWYFKGSQRFGISKHSHVPRFERVSPITNEAKRVKERRGKRL